MGIGDFNFFSYLPTQFLVDPDMGQINSNVVYTILADTRKRNIKGVMDYLIQFEGLLAD